VSRCASIKSKTDAPISKTNIPARYDQLHEAAEVSVGAERLVFTTDSFVVSPLRFPSGDIGSLAVNGTINELAVMGARPLALSAAFILEERFPIAELRELVQSMSRASRHADVPIVAADTKVVERGKADGLFITTSGIGVVSRNLRLAPEQAQPGDAVLVSGPIGDHGIAVMSAREGLEFQTTLVSDCAPLHELTALMLDSGGHIRCVRDLTRGGVATILNELAKSSGVEIVIEEQHAPVRGSVRAACEILGLEPLYVACEGRLLAIADDAHADRILDAMRRHPLGEGSCRIGTVAASSQPRVLSQPRSAPPGFWIRSRGNSCRESVDLAGLKSRLLEIARREHVPVYHVTGVFSRSPSIWILAHGQDFELRTGAELNTQAAFA
jgi:hydrogenase expression/formation protein HypE